MLLLNSSTTCLPQFVSLCFVLNTEEYDERSVQMVSPILVPGPLSCVSQTQVLEALKELLFHLNSTIKAATESASDPEDHIAMSFFKEDARQMEDVQLFSPLATAGIGLYYRLIRTDNKTIVSRIANIILMANKSTPNPPNLTSVDGIWGFLLCVGFTGLPMLSMTSDLFYHLSERVSDAKEILTKRCDMDVNSIKTLLATLLLFEDDARLTNARIENNRLICIPEPDEGPADKKSSLISPLGVRMKRAAGKNSAMEGDGEPREREDCYLQLDNIMQGAEDTRLMMERLKVLSVAESQTLLQKYAHSAVERKANLDLTGGTGKGRFTRKRTSGRDADFDNFDYKGPSRGTPMVAATNLTSIPTPSSSTTTGSLGSPSLLSSHHNQTSSKTSLTTSQSTTKTTLRLPSKDTKLKGPPTLSAPRHDGGGRSRRAIGTDDSTVASVNTNSFDPFGKQKSYRHVEEEDAGTVINQGRLQVNVALNEDLSCSYRSSQITSCTVEGVVQVQIKASSPQAPFYLLLRDSTEQVQSFQENQKYADDFSNTLVEEDDADRKYRINVPSGESYFPVVRYKCVEDLRPVPIRVQTRTKTENNFCRVALQISSNPNNEAKLSDLTIIMGVPEDVQGESLLTQPAGGVWNEAKRCVTWCVEELAEGEKFQLQARFQLSPTAKYEQSGEKPMFPVLVRCQCLFAQLSDLELEIRDIPEQFPADVTMKIARRFRLSHRERS